MSETEHDALAAAVSAFLPGEQREWWRRAFEATSGPLDRRRFESSFAAASRKVGTEPVDVGDGRGERPLDHALRALLLARAVALVEPEARAAFVHRLFETGDSREREAVLRALPELPDPERYTATAAEACRTNVVSVFEAVACENPYAALYFEQAPFNQMVIKAIFLGVAAARVEGLEELMNPELARMARDYAAERRAAGRPVPEDAIRLGAEEVPQP